MVPAMTTLLTRIASLVGRRPRAATLAVLLAVTAVIGGAIAAGGSFKDDFTVPGIESQQAQDLLEKRFEAQSGTQAVVVFSTGDGALERPGPKRDIQTALAKISRQPHVAVRRGSLPDRRPALRRRAHRLRHRQLRPDRD